MLSEELHLLPVVSRHGPSTRAKPLKLCCAWHGIGVGGAAATRGLLLSQIPSSQLLLLLLLLLQASRRRHDVLASIGGLPFARYAFIPLTLQA
jgi:hypothetical protein